jgi:hypothetical protein
VKGVAKADTSGKRSASASWHALAAVAAALLCSAAVGGASAAASTSHHSTPAAAGAKSFTLYSSFQQLQYLDHADDRARGEGANPFGNYTHLYVPPQTNEKLYGPFAGDIGEYAFNLSSDAAISNTTGSAIFICQYALQRQSFCNADFQLSGGTLIAKGEYAFGAATITLAIIGGTGNERGATGEVVVTGATPSAANQPLVFYANPPSLMVEPQRLAFVVSPPATAPSHTANVYSYPSEQQYLDHNDDEARGDEDNPFGTLIYRKCADGPHYQVSLCDAALTKAAALKTDEHNNGPFAGDTAIFKFNLYPHSNRKGKLGTAVLSCQYYFKHNAFCDAVYQLSGGTLIGEGTFNFDTNAFSLAITGGYGSFSSVLGGEVDITPGSNGTQHLSFELG